LTDVSSVVFAPASGERNGHLLFLRENNLMAQPFDARSLQTSGDVFPVAEKIALANTNNYAPVSVSENDVLLYWAGGSGGAGGDFQMIWYDRGGKVPELVGAPANVLMPAISPDEKSIAFSKAGAGTTRDIWLRDLVRGSERRFTIDPSSNNVPFWSPKTGERIVFRSNRGNKSGLYIRASSGSGQDEVLVSTPNNTIADQWSRDARFIVYSEQDPKTRWDLWVLPMDDSGKPSGKPTPFLHSGFSEIDGQLSPDSKWMAYTSDVSGAREVYVQPFPAADNEIRISTAGGEQPRWRGDGRELYYIAADGKMTAVTVTETAGPKPSLKAGTPVALFDAHSASAPSTTNSYFNYDVTADGKRFLVSALGAGAASASAQAVPPLTVQVNWRPAGRK
jgi:dipeptidyl aminopeptidase/acylaminoacyl peptidase